MIYFLRSGEYNNINKSKRINLKVEKSEAKAIKFEV
jgi:hypothetical protein